MRFFGRRKKENELDQRITTAVKSELDGYITREGLEEHLKQIEKDETKKRIWASLSRKKKVTLLRRMKKDANR